MSSSGELDAYYWLSSRYHELDLLMSAIDEGIDEGNVEEIQREMDEIIDKMRKLTERMEGTDD